MSSLTGQPEERLSLARMVDALADAARHAGRPQVCWLVGVVYPGLNLNIDLVRGVLALIQSSSGIHLPGAGGGETIMTLFAPGLPPQFAERVHATPELLFVTLPLILVLYRPVVGLAKLSDPTLWTESSSAPGRPARGPALKRVWREGAGLALVGFGLWAMLVLLLFGALLFLIGPLVALVKVLGLGKLSPLFAGLLLPVLPLILAYAAVLMVVNQLALHSLAHNRRGVASALTHAWRLVRASPLGALRATAVDFVLFLSVLVLGGVLRTFLQPGFLDEFVPLAMLLLYGFAGVTRAGFWARTYRALGGLSSADHVPGL